MTYGRPCPAANVPSSQPSQLGPLLQPTFGLSAALAADSDPDGCANQPPAGRGTEQGRRRLPQRRRGLQRPQDNVRGGDTNRRRLCRLFVRCALWRGTAGKENLRCNVNNLTHWICEEETISPCLQRKLTVDLRRTTQHKPITMGEAGFMFSGGYR